MPRIATILKKGFTRLLLGFALLGGAVGMTAFQFWLFLHSPGSPRLGIQQVEIPAGMKAAQIARRLAAAGVVADDDLFRLLCRLRRAGENLKAGDYAFLSLSTPTQVLEQIIAGKAAIQRVTFPEGVSVYEVAKTFHERGLAFEKEILQLVMDPEFAKANGLPAESLEGFLFPETYFFQRSQSEAAMLGMMIRQFWRHLPEGWEQQAAQVGLTLQEIVTMASMVEKEAKVDSERSLIAGVFHNRLRERMPLQSDPTAVYDLPDFSGPITPAQLKRQSPYNTYQKRGLPIGPICNPGAKSLKAALFPETVPYLYFVSKRDGTHQFSQTLAEHNQAVSRWRPKPLDGGPPADH